MEKYDVIVILGGGINQDCSLSEISCFRVKKGVDEYLKNLASSIIVSGKWSFLLSESFEKTEAEAMKEYAIFLGVKTEDILLEDESNDTISNAFFVKERYLIPNNWKNIIVVTSNFHLERVKYIFSKILGKSYNVTYAAVDSTLSEKELSIKLRVENKILELIKKWMDDIESGDDVAIRNFLFTTYPGFAKKPEISRSDLLKIAENSYK